MQSLQKAGTYDIFSAVMHMKKKFKGTLALLVCTGIWGSAFIAQSVGMDYIGPFTFQAVRCALAAVFLALVIFPFDRMKGARAGYWARWCDRQLWKAGILCGTVLAVASGLQQTGIVYTTAGKAGFITAMYIVLVPLLGIVFRRRPSPAAWGAVGLAVAGLYLLSCAGAAEINKGDLLLLASALGFAVQITLIDRTAGAFDVLRFNCIQSLVCAVLSAAMMLITEEPTWAAIHACRLPIAYAGILSMGVAFSLQIIGQKHLDPTAASLIMSLESVFAALFGWLLLHETMTPTELTGCALVFSGVILSQLPSSLFIKKIQR